MNVFIQTNDQGGVTIRYPLQQNVQPAEGEAIINSTLLPTERTFRDAWQFDGQQVTVDMAVARVLFINVLREVRNAKLAEMDGLMLRAIEQFDDEQQAIIAVEKEQLRNLPATVNVTAAQSPEALLALWPVGDLGPAPMHF